MTEDEVHAALVVLAGAEANPNATLRAVAAVVETTATEQPPCAGGGALLVGPEVERGHHGRGHHLAPGRARGADRRRRR